MADSVVRLVEEGIRPGIPTSIRNQLVAEARKLWRDRIPREVVLQALKEWDARPGLSPGILPHLVSDIVRKQRNTSADDDRLAPMRDWESRLREEMGD